MIIKVNNLRGDLNDVSAERQHGISGVQRHLHDEDEHPHAVVESLPCLYTHQSYGMPYQCFLG